MKKHTLALFTLLFALPSTGWSQTAPVALAATSAAQEETPTPVAFLRRFLEGVRTLKPCTIEYDTKGSLPGTRTPRYRGTIIWQDWQHMVIKATEGPAIGEAYVNGAQSWTYLPATKMYTEGLPAGLRGTIRQLPATLIQIQHTAPVIVENPWASFLLSTLRVTAETLDGEPVYRLAAVGAPGSVPADSPIGSVSLVVGRNDYLPRRVTVTGTPEYARDITLKFTKARAPYPPSTFAFTPPAGAKRLPSLGKPNEPRPAAQPK